MTNNDNTIINNNKKVIIIGAGISGLTVAHELSKKGFNNIHIYEKNRQIGGMARSVRLNESNIPTEHSWRAYGPFYKNCYQLMKEIPLVDKNNKNNINENNTENFNNLKDDNNLKKYTIEDINKFKDSDKIICYLDNIVYDVTEFKKQHPGGTIINNAKGANLKDIWDKFGYSWHLDNNNVKEMLNKYKIGILSDNFKNDKILKTVYDNINNNKLNFKLLKNNLTYPNLINFISPQDYFYVFYYFLKYEMACQERRNKYYNQQFINIFNEKTLSTVSYDYLINFGAGPALGFDINTASYGQYAQVVLLNKIFSNSYWRVMNQPTSEAWFDHWYIFLSNKEIQFHFNHELNDIILINEKEENNNNNQSEGFNNLENNNIKHFIINNKAVIGDYYVLAVEPNSLVKFKNKINLISNEEIINDNLNVINNQIGFIIGFNKKINYENNNDSFVLVDSNNNISFYPQEMFWKNTIDLGTYKNNKIKTLWSGIIVLPYLKGLIYNESMMNLNINEIKTEIKAQILKSEDFKAYIAANNNNYELKEEDFMVIELFEDWIYDEDKKQLISQNPKWVNTFYNYKYQPTQYIKSNQLFLTGAHTRTSLTVWSMEAAVESGKLTTNAIIESYNNIINNRANKISNKISKINVFRQPNGLLIFSLFRGIDYLLYKLNLPHVIFVAYILIISMVIYLIIKYL